VLRRFWRPETGIFLAIWLVLMVGGHSRLFRDPGTFWHTVVGQRILERGEFLNTDPFSYTFGGTPWTPYEWLGECGMALVHDLSGLDGLLLATVTVLAGLFTWVAHRLIRCGLHWSLAAVVAALALGASASHLHVRPHILTIGLLGITFGWLCDFEAGKWSLKRLFWLIPLFVLWTNIHGGMLGGLGTLGLALVAWTVLFLFRQPTPFQNLRQLGLFAVLVVLCGLTCLVNPYGMELPWTWYTIMRSPLLPQIIVEHSPLRPTSPEGLTVLAFGAVYVVMVLSTLPKRPRITWLLPLVWFVLAWTRIRHAPLFCITASLALADIVPQTIWAAWLVRRGSDLFRPASAEPRRWDWRPALVPVCVVLGTLFVQMTGWQAPVVGAGWAQLDPSYWPTELIADLKAHENTRPGGTRIFNEYILGGFLIYHAPGYRVFVDDRCEVYGDEWLVDFVGAANDDTAGHIERWQDRYGSFDMVLTHTGSGFDRYFAVDPGWVTVRRTEPATLYRRVQPGDLALGPLSGAIAP
jgi:hypothetical protein